MYYAQHAYMPHTIRCLSIDFVLRIEWHILQAFGRTFNSNTVVVACVKDCAPLLLDYPLFTKRTRPHSPHPFHLCGFVLALKYDPSSKGSILSAPIQPLTTSDFFDVQINADPRTKVEPEWWIRPLRMRVPHRPRCRLWRRRPARRALSPFFPSLSRRRPIRRVGSIPPESSSASMRHPSGPRTPPTGGTWTR